MVMTEQPETEVIARMMASRAVAALSPPFTESMNVTVFNTEGDNTTAGNCGD